MRTAFVQGHRQQALALSFLAVCLVALCVVLFLVNTWLHLTWDRTVSAFRIDDRLRGVIIVLGVAWATAWLAGTLMAAAGSSRPLPILARLGGQSRVRWTGMVGAGSFWLAAACLAGMSLYADRVARPLDGNPAQLYILYDDTQAPRWVMALVSSPTIHAAERHWGRGSTIVAPITPRSFAEALARGRFVYVAVHGDHGPLLHKGGEITPQDVERGMPVGKGLRLVYLSACYSGNMAAEWETALAPARVVSYPRFSAHLEHAHFLWVQAPRIIAGHD
jgi:hypothetical protein